MGLKSASQDFTVDSTDRRITERDFSQLTIQLNSLEPSERRWAARDLSGCEHAAKTLISALATEKDIHVVEAIFSSLQQLPNNDTVKGLMELLHSEDAAIRNGAIEVLQSMPHLIETHILALLNDQDSDVRIFAIDILQELAHPNTPQWLLSVLKDETHVNVVSTAIDRLAEVATNEMEPDLLNVKIKFAEHDYVQFAVDMALSRLEGAEHA